MSPSHRLRCLSRKQGKAVRLRLRPGDQATHYTSGLAKLLGKAAPDTISPVRVDALMRGYLGTLGLSIAATTSAVHDSFAAGEAPDRRPEEWPLIGRYLRRAPARSTIYVEDFYELRDEVTRLMGSARAYIRQGRLAEAQALLADNPNAPGLYRMVNTVAERMQAINAELRRLREDPAMPGSEKRQQIDFMLAQRNELAKQALAGR